MSRTRGVSRPALVLSRAVLLAVALALPATAAGSESAPMSAPPPVAPAAPTVRIEDRTGAAGPVRMVLLDGWPMGPVTVEVCGLEARRSSVDCDTIGAQSASVPLGASAAVRLPALTPPVDCPCVIRASTRDHRTVVRVPVVVPGRRVVPKDELPPDPAQRPHPEDLAVTARIEPPGTWFESLRSSLGFADERTLAVTVRNQGPVAMAGLQAAASFGPASQPGAPLVVPAIDELAPGQERTFRVAVEVPAAGFGTYAGSGRVFGLDAAVPFRAEMDNRPVALAVVVVATVSALVLHRLRSRRRRRSGSQVTGA